MSDTHDTNPSRGRPVLKRFDHFAGIDDEELKRMMVTGRLWMFCGEFEGSEQKAADMARTVAGNGTFKVFPSGSWPGGYLRD